MQLIADKIPGQMGNSDNYQIKYWNDLENFSYKSPKPERSIKRKLAIVFSFIFVLAVTPTLIMEISNFDAKPAKEVSVASTQSKQNLQNSVNTQPEVHKVTIELPKKAPAQAGQAEVINNDSYWKISKRVCGDGKYYLSIQAQNENKPLHVGNTVAASCVL